MSNKEVVKQENSVLDPSLFEGMPTGFEGTTSDTFKIPFLKILQKQSPEVDKDDPNHVKGAEYGTYLNTATKQTYKSFNAVVLKIEHNLLVWKPDRGGLVGIFDKSMEGQIVAKRDGLFKLDQEGNEIDDTISIYFMNADDPTDIFVLPLSRTGFKYGQAFATRIRALKMNGKAVKVTWAGVWSIGIAQDKNDKGSWYTMGNTPEFQQFVDAEMVNSFIKPSLEILKTAETDYNQMSENSSTSVEGEESF